MLLVEETFVLVYWPEEDCVSVVPGARVSGDHQSGTDCSVIIRKKEYTGQVAATGKCIRILTCRHVKNNTDCA